MRAQSSGKSALGVRIMETPAGLPVTDSGWEIRPEAMLEQLLEFRDDMVTFQSTSLKMVAPVPISQMPPKVQDPRERNTSVII